MPSSWKTIRLSEIARIYDGTHQTPTYVDEGIPFYSVEHITSDDFDDTKFISEEVFAAESRRVVLEKCDILMTRIGDVGNAKYIDWDVRASFYVSLALLKCKEDVDPQFITYLINSDTGRREIWAKTLHVAFPNKINLGDIGKCAFGIPPKGAQIQIVKILSVWDDYLEKLDLKIAAKKNIKKGLMQQLLSGNRRLTCLDDDWETISLGDVAIIKRGGSPRPIEAYITAADDGLNWLRIGDIKNGSRYITKTSQKIKPEGLKKTTIVHEGDFILSNSMSFGRPYIMKISACIHDGWLALMDIKQIVNKSFLFYMLSSSKIQGKFKALSAGSGVQNLKKETVATVEIQLPSLEEQKLIAKILHDADDEIEMLTEQRNLVVKQRDYLINNLVTGKIRLPISESTTNREAVHA